MNDNYYLNFILPPNFHVHPLMAKSSHSRCKNTHPIPESALARWREAAAVIIQARSLERFKIRAGGVISCSREKEDQSPAYKFIVRREARSEREKRRRGTRMDGDEFRKRKSATQREMHAKKVAISKVCLVSSGMEIFNKTGCLWNPDNRYVCARRRNFNLYVISSHTYFSNLNFTYIVYDASCRTATFLCHFHLR